MQILHLNPNDGFIAQIYHASLQQFLPQPFLFLMGVARKMMSSWLQLSLITTSVASSTARVLLASCGPASFILLCIMPRLFFVWPSLCKRTRATTADCRASWKSPFTKIAFCNGGGNVTSVVSWNKRQIHWRRPTCIKNLCLILSCCVVSWS
jgi:hypothetical protein